MRNTIRNGLLATVAAMVATTLGAALAMAAGVDFETPDGGEAIPLAGFATMTGVFSLVGVVLAVTLRRYFRWTAVALTALSLVPPVLTGANAATVATLCGLHLIAAAIMIPTLVRSLRQPARTSSRAGAVARKLTTASSNPAPARATPSQAEER
ncbi:hypothetical protein GCM10010168_27700 [Actinoplanes ianthinogenes]|uniref:Secreted protein n=1 Tax=Actinoplanes ianthinogenes TaxID=122358 RepID=A0ABM7LKW7_9ACTN|nr:DUF6069 family protein [Actinoplanes ianthinogenes]BCJ39911.1 hypothetical protein Aiant_05680 [Actinoplanes ianthinogenes]GGR08955.1 hypothetical protein GCM10010168_27700 [Actinoplanes ianthinogenes]